VAVDRQLKSGYGTYEAAEKAALAIKKQHPKLHVSVYDAKADQHTSIALPEPATGANRIRMSGRATRNALKWRANRTSV
jgi:hypothetical protein